LRLCGGCESAVWNVGTAILEELLSMEYVHSLEMFMAISCIYGGVMQRTTCKDSDNVLLKVQHSFCCSSWKLSTL